VILVLISDNLLLRCHLTKEFFGNFVVYDLFFLALDKKQRRFDVFYHCRA